MKQERVQRKAATHNRGQEQELAEQPVEQETAEELKADLEDILDEIDAVLEENAEEFVAGYVQRGGE